MLLAELDLARGHRESALGRVQAIAEATKTRVDTAVWLGTILQSLGQIPDAKEVREKLLTRYPDDIGVRLFDINLARSPSGQFDIDAALASIDQLPASPQRDFLRGQLRLAFGQIEAADESFRQAIDARSLDESSWRSVIDFLRWRNSDRLEAVVERAKAAFPEADWILDLTRS
jgi:tetratricopeptide (TPR) repeat protein